MKLHDLTEERTAAESLDLAKKLRAEWKAGNWREFTVIAKQGFLVIEEALLKVGGK